MVVAALVGRLRSLPVVGGLVCQTVVVVELVCPAVVVAAGSVVAVVASVAAGSATARTAPR